MFVTVVYSGHLPSQQSIHHPYPPEMRQSSDPCPCTTLVTSHKVNEPDFTVLFSHVKKEVLIHIAM